MRLFKFLERKKTEKPAGGFGVWGALVELSEVAIVLIVVLWFIGVSFDDVLMWLHG